jgi:Preprotein translocase subunit SecF
MRIIKETNIDFMIRSTFGFFFSSTIIIVGIISLILNGGPNLSIDFKGGTLIAVNYTKPVDINKIRSSMKNVMIEGPDV